MEERDYLKELEDLLGCGDPECAHAEADDILCDLILKYVPNGTKIVKTFLKIDKWYA